MEETHGEVVQPLNIGINREGNGRVRNEGVVLGRIVQGGLGKVDTRFMAMLVSLSTDDMRRICPKNPSLALYIRPNPKQPSFRGKDSNFHTDIDMR